MKTQTEGQKKYALKLKDPKWKERRLQIIKRDYSKCRKCGSTKNLQVHHLYYTNNDPWDYPGSALVTLCKFCHKAEHKGKTSTNFTRHKAKKLTKFPNKKGLIHKQKAKKKRKTILPWHSRIPITIDDYNQFYGNTRN